MILRLVLKKTYTALKTMPYAYHLASLNAAHSPPFGVPSTFPLSSPPSSCPFGFRPSDINTCVPVMDCSIPRCHNGGYCVTIPVGDDGIMTWRCVRPEEWHGRHCNETGPITDRIVVGVAGGTVARPSGGGAGPTKGSASMSAWMRARSTTTCATS